MPKEAFGTPRERRWPQNGSCTDSWLPSQTWWNSTNQDRSDRALQALVDWLSYNPYKSVISGIAPVNEPNGVWFATQGNRLDVTAEFYGRSYATLSKANYTMFMHHGFANNPTDYWRPFCTGKDPSLLTFNNNPYEGMHLHSLARRRQGYKNG